MRRHGLVILGVIALGAVIATSARAHSTPGIRQQQARARDVQAEVDQIGRQLTAVEGQAQNAEYRLTLVNASLKSNTQKLRVVRSNFHASQQRIMARVYQLYVDGRPSTLDVLSGAKNLSDVINRAETAQVVSQQDSALAHQALNFEHAVQHRQESLKRLRAIRAKTVLRLAAQKREIEASLAQKKRLLASIHETIHQLQVKEAQHEAALRAAAEARLRAERLAEQEQQQQQQQSNAGGGVPSIPPVFGGGGSDGGTGAGHPEAAQIALQYLGVPYVWGGASPSGFDCSGLVMYVYAQLGISLPHYTVSQWDATEPISTSEMQPGDLVFFDDLGHVGIYIGHGEFVDAPHTGSVVRIDSLAGWGSSFVGARRVP